MRQLLDGGVLENVHARSEQLRQRLEGIVDRHDLPRGVRGKGLLLGLELNKEVAGDVVVAGVGQGVLLNPVRPDVVRMMPPLTITEEEIDRGVERLEAAIREVESR